MKRIRLVLALMAIAACGDDEPTRQEGTLKTRPSMVFGSLSGRVLDPLERPIPGATIRVTSPRATRTQLADANGFFHFRELPAGGTVEVRIEVEGHTNATLFAELDADAGDQPQNETHHDLGDVLLFPLGDDLVVPVTTAAGDPLDVQGAYCSVGPVHVVDKGEDREYSPGKIVSAESTPGELRCRGIPKLDFWAGFDGGVGLFVPAQDVDGDGHADYQGSTWWFSARELNEGRSTSIRLDTFGDDSLEVVRSNIHVNAWDPLIPPLGVEEDVEIVFSRPVQVEFARIVEYREEDLPPLDLPVEVEGDRVRISNPEGWKEGMIYLLLLAVSPSGSRNLLGLEAIFVVESSGELQATATFEDADGNGVTDSGEPITVSFSEYVFFRGGGDVEVQVDYDLDGSGEIGDAPFELGSDEARPLIASSPATPVTRAVVALPVPVPAGAKLVVRSAGQVMFDTSGNPVALPPLTLEAEE